jgi:hypothetical protein
VKIVPHEVPIAGRPGEFVEKVKSVFGRGESGAGGEERPYPEAFGEYRRAAEEAMERESIPPPLREFVKDYFEAVRPK